MTAPVQAFRITVEAKHAGTGRYRVLVDRQPLDELLDELAQQRTKRPWADRARCLIEPSELKRSGEVTGSYLIVVCANCAASGYMTADDIGLAPVEVAHGERVVTWTVVAPDVHDESTPPLTKTLTFDRGQYLRELEKISAT